MGLGKTLEVLALVLTHPRSTGTPDHSRSGSVISKNRAQGKQVPCLSAATLIVCPKPLIMQWQEETLKHAPSLKTFVYEGCNDFENTLEDLCKSDIVFTTYNQLRVDTNTGKDVQVQSPLLSVFWWRICLDEAQMVADTTIQAAIMASDLWRVNCW